MIRMNGGQGIRRQVSEKTGRLTIIGTVVGQLPLKLRPLNLAGADVRGDTEMFGQEQIKFTVLDLRGHPRIRQIQARKQIVEILFEHARSDNTDVRLAAA
jgi:hypothetical protein